ncbi:triose-phosphate isomerase [Meiothermus sp. QL-1]|uniref:triose-phosphate isomerase n=1 Tax=Meiothermus sp. QL-1 TaxID=2058095 RepID=UPI000E0AA1AA|nr:triose-phosphate isomerase [Meiothermus sp. QL-1]RDI95010.1 triose-phosphate isomerase [Meiothermus sp. QL-1]
MRRRLVAGNWKMHKTPSEALVWFQALLEKLPPTGAEPALLVPFTHLPYAAQTLKQRVAYGAQDVSAHTEGAYTGEVSARMLADLGCRYTIVGHSERRSYHGETDALVAEKAQRLLEVGIVPILCVGEPLAVRQVGGHLEYTLGQLERSLAGVSLPSPAHLVVAYEPVWAIGTGQTATPEDAEAMHRAIRGWLGERYGEAFAEEVRILYGGSIKPENAGALFRAPNVDGGLVGGASLMLEDYLRLLSALE